MEAVASGGLRASLDALDDETQVRVLLGAPAGSKRAEADRLQNGAQDMSKHSLSMPQGADQLQHVLPILCSQALRLNETSYNVQVRIASFQLHI